MREHIRKLLREALGVPTGLINASKILYKEIVDSFDYLEEQDNKDIYTTEFNIDLSIGNDYQINEIKLILQCHKSDRVEKPTIASLALGSQYDIDRSKLKVRYMVSDNIVIMISVAVPNSEWDLSDIKQLLKDQKEEIIRSMGHELKHAYDKYKKPNDAIFPTAMYQSYTSISLGLPPIDRFLFYLYFIHASEGLVRASEVATSMVEKGITKKKFLDFITNDKTYKQLKEISEFSYEKLKKDLENYESKIDEVLDKLDQPTDVPLKEKIENFLKIVHNTIMNHKAETARTFLQTTLPEKIFGILLPEKEEFFIRILNKINRFKSYKDFFEYEEKMFKFVSKKLMKKISKLYSMSKDDENILDWDLHQKMNKKTKFVKESKYFKKLK